MARLFVRLITVGNTDEGYISGYVRSDSPPRSDPNPRLVLEDNLKNPGFHKSQDQRTQNERYDNRFLLFFAIIDRYRSPLSTVNGEDMVVQERVDEETALVPREDFLS